MKRVLLAFALLARRGGGLCSLNHDRKAYDRPSHRYDRPHRGGFRCGRIRPGVNAYRRVHRGIYQTHQTFHFFMRHSDVSKIEENVITLPILLEAGDHGIFQPNSPAAATSSISSESLELPSFDNIL